MSSTARRITGRLARLGALLGAALAVACSGGGGAYGSNDPAASPP